MSADYEVIALGGGLIGASCAFVLARQGRRTLLLERFRPGHERGSSHGDGRMIRFDYSEPVYVEMVSRAYRAWDDLAERAGEPLYRRTGICNFGPCTAPALDALQSTLHTFQLPFERLSANASNKRFPMYHLESGSETLYQPDGGALFADRAVRALWDGAKAAGADTLCDAEVVAIEPSGARIRVFTSDGSFSSSGLILAAGAWSDRWLRRLGLDLPLTVTGEQIAYFPARGGVEHSVGIMPNAIDYHTPQPFYCVPQIAVPGVKAGWHHTGAEIDAERPAGVNAENLKAVTDFIHRRCPHLMPEPFHVKPCLYTNSPDFHFILDRHPEYPNIVFGAGFSGHGFKFGPVLGEMLVSRLFDQPPPVDMRLFSIDRFNSPETLIRRAIA